MTSEPTTIVVSGVASGAGKTSLAVAVIEFLHERNSVAAVKITVTHDDRGCPHGGKSCNVCSSLGGDFQIISKGAVIQQAGTDTARFVEAGADPVRWGITRDTNVLEMWRRVTPTLKPAGYVVVESNTLALLIKPAINLMIVDPSVSRRLWKPSATALIRSADLVVFNKRGSSQQVDSTWSEVKSLRPERNIVQVAHPSAMNVDAALITILNTKI